MSNTKVYKIQLTKKQLYSIIDKIDDKLSEIILSQIEVQEKDKINYHKLYYLSHKEQYRKRYLKTITDPKKKEKLREYNKQWRKKHPGYMKRYSKKYYLQYKKELKGGKNG